MLAKKTVIRIISAYLEECKRQGIALKKAYLFGSYAKGTFGKYSDIDIALVSDNFSKNPIKNWRMMSSVDIKFSRIESHPFTIADFKKGNPYFDEIKKTGIDIKL